MNFKLIEIDGRETVEVNADIGELIDCAQNGFKDYCNRPRNVKSISDRYLGNADTSGYKQFAGGTYDDLFKLPDMREYERFKNELAKSKLMQRVVNKNNLVNRRRRSFSEHEGEWSLDRRWEIKPFSNAKRIPTPARFIDIYCYFNIHAGVGQEEITRYGIALWSINNVLETAGIGTRIFYVQQGRRVADPDYGSNKRMDTFIKILLKEPSKYISPIALAKCLTANFYRRVMFSTMISAVDFADADHADHLGEPIWEKKVMEFKNGELHIYPDAMNSGNSNMEKAILDIIEKV